MVTPPVTFLEAERRDRRAKRTHRLTRLWINNTNLLSGRLYRCTQLCLVTLHFTKVVSLLNWSDRFPKELLKPLGGSPPPRSCGAVGNSGVASAAWPLSLEGPSRGGSQGQLRQTADGQHPASRALRQR